MFSNLLNGHLTALLEGFSVGIILDLVFAAILALFAFLNFRKGLTKQVLGIAVTIGSLLIAYFFCDEVLRLADKLFSVSDKLAGALLNAGKNNEALNAAVSTESLAAAIQSMNLPQFIGDFAGKALATATQSYATIGQFLTHILSHYILIAVFFIITWILARIILSLIKKLLVNIVNLPGLNAIDKILGLVLGLIKGILILYALIYVVEILPNSIGNIESIKNALGESIIGGLLKQYNLVSVAFTWLVGKFKF